MARKLKTKKPSKPRGPGMLARWWSARGAEGQRSVVVALLTALLVATVCTGATLGLRQLRRYVLTRPQFMTNSAEVVLVDRPNWSPLLVEEIQAELLDPAQRENWTFDQSLARRVHEAAQRCPWVHTLHEVRVERAPARQGDNAYGRGRVLVRAQWRRPVAIACWVGDETVEEYVDEEGYVLPMHQVGNVPLPRIIGLRAPPPPDAPRGQRAQPWEGEDLRAALALLTRLAGKIYYSELAAVDVANFGKRRNLRDPEVALIFEGLGLDGQAAQTRVLFGRVPLDDMPAVGEPSLTRKIDFLDGYYRRYGRIAGPDVLNLQDDRGLRVRYDSALGSR